jgi:hypothetical protein
MLAIGIKNAILFFLIIMIMHFLLKNILFDKQQPQKSYFENFEEKQKMMDYIFKESNSIVKECNNEEKCLPIKTDDTVASSKDLPTTCDAEVTEKKEEDMVVKADCQLSQEKKSFMVIKEYENERGMNGGKLFDGLDAYDGYDLYFQTYSSQCGAPVS